MTDKETKVVGTLTIAVEYAEGTDADEIEVILSDAARLLAGRGLLHDDGFVELDSWDYSVKIHLMDKESEG